MKRAMGCALLAGAAVLSNAVPAAQTSSVHERIAAAVGRIRLVDTHEHLPPEADRLKAVLRPRVRRWESSTREQGGNR